jgi:hypothetical protein
MIREEMTPEQQPVSTEQQAPVEQQSPTEQPIQPNEQASEQIEGKLVEQDNVTIGPGQQAQLDAYTDNATIVVFSEKSQPAILQSLQAGQDPVANVANTLFLVHGQLESSLAKDGEKMTEITMAIGGAHLTSELIVLAEAAKLYTLDETQKMDAYQKGIMRYFEAGLKDGSIDPVELQKTLEPVMNDKQREFGMRGMEQGGISKTAPPAGGNIQPQVQPQQGILGGV